MVTRLLERLARWQLALISMAVGAGLLAGGMWIFNRAHKPKPMSREEAATIDQVVRDMTKPKAIDECQLEAMRYGHKNTAEQGMYVEQCMRVRGFRPAYTEGLERKCGDELLIAVPSCWQ
jgi:hypothetical protein